MTNQAASRALAQVMDLFKPGSSAPTISGDYAQGVARCYGSDFSTLWNFHDDKPASRTVLIWDSGTVSDGVGNTNVEAHLGALAWATCALMAHRDLEVVILDPSSERHRRESQLYRFVEAIQPTRMPWLRLVTLDNFGRFLMEDFTRGENFDSASESGRQRAEMLQLLSHQMREELTREGGENDRHAIQNIVGPMVLLGREYFAKKGVAERALLQVFEATGLMSKDLVQGSEPINKIKEESWGDQPLRLLLVDDQADCGWADWVRSNLPSSKPNLVSLDKNDVITLPEAFLANLDAELKLSGKTGDRRFELQLTGGVTPRTSKDSFHDARQTILLLDLRLHSMRSADDEVAFFKKLLPLCERFKSDGMEGSFAWPGFSPQELQDVESWCKNPKHETDKHFLRLSLLPRLVALLDMSLPIIIFSSTGQRSIIEKFKAYGNIITDFEKPRFFGRDARNVLTEAQEKFTQAIGRAVKINEARSACSTLRLIRRVTPTITVSRKARVAHLFVDESGNLETSDYFSIGAFIVMADSQDSLNQFSAELEKTHNWGFSCSNYVSPPPTDWRNEGRWIDSVLQQIPIDYLAKNRPENWSWQQYQDLMNEVLGDINNRLTSNGFQWAAAAFRYRIDDRNTYDSGTGGLDSIFDHDMLFRKGLRDLLRFVVADYPVVKEFLNRPDTLLSVDVASRELRANKFSETRYREDMEHRFAARFRKTRDGYGLMTLNGYDVFPLVASLFTDLGIPLSKLDKARAVILHDYQSVSQYPSRMRVPEALPLQIHYLADWLAKCASWRDHERPKRIKSWFERGFIQERSLNFDELWNVASTGRKGLITEAIDKLRHLQFAREADLSAGVSAERYLRQAVSEWPKTLTGNAFRTLVRRLMNSD